MTVVIPSINSRPTLLPLAIASIRAAANTCSVRVVLIGPSDSAFAPEVIAAVDEFITEPGGIPLASKIDYALQRADTEFSTWLGDDDLLTEGSIDRALAYLRKQPAAVAVFGGCQYIDSDGHPLVLNRSGAWAVPLLTFGPQLIPQPSVVWRSASYRATGGLSPAYQLAFDFDLFLKLRKLGPIGFINQTQSCFRWHPDSLSVKRRKQSVLEASLARRSNCRPAIRLVAWLWEPVVIGATWLAGKLLTRRLAARAGRR